jgi:hypothetical protein
MPSSKTPEELKREREAHEELKKLRAYSQLPNSEKRIYLALLLGGSTIRFIKKAIREARRETV